MKKKHILTVKRLLVNGKYCTISLWHTKDFKLINDIEISEDPLKIREALRVLWKAIINHLKGEHNV